MGSCRFLARSLDIVNSTFKSPMFDLNSGIFRRQSGRSSVSASILFKFVIQYLWPTMLMWEFCTFRLSQKAVLTFILLKLATQHLRPLMLILNFPTLFRFYE
jgi:hypothetical protein